MAWCIADLERMDGSPYGCDSRAVLQRAVDEYAERGYVPVSARSSSSTCASPTRRREYGYRRYVDNPSHVYTVGHVADPRGVLREMLHACADLGLGALRGEPRVRPRQFEINLAPLPHALDAADRAFLFKTMVKEMAARAWPARHVHRQAVERRRGLRLPPAHLARLTTAARTC